MLRPSFYRKAAAMRTQVARLAAAAGVALIVFPITAAHAGGQYGDIRPGAVLRHVEHLSQNSTKGWAVSASADGRTVASGGPVQNALGYTFGHVDVWVQTSTGWTLQADLASPETHRTSDGFGLAVSLSADGQHLAVGDLLEPDADRENLWYGAVYVYDRTATGWSAPTRLDSPDQSFEGEFGTSVALNADGSALIAGAPYDGIFDGRVTGAAWAFTRTSAGWGQAQPLVPADDQSRRGFGGRVAISGDGRYAAVTNPYATVGGADFAGSVITFARSSSDSWTQTSVLADKRPVRLGQFGASVAMSSDGSTIATGGGDDAVVARVLIFRRTGTTWTRSATFPYNSDTPTHSSLFGSAVALSSTGDVVAVGAPYRTTGPVANSGGVYRYGWNGSAWSYLGATFVRGAGQDEHDGWSVALSGDAGRLFIGAPGYRRPGAHPSLTGATYVLG